MSVCEGYAKAFKCLLDMMSIPCNIVYGFGYDSRLGIEESHAWNLIRIDGNWLHVDTTYDTTIRSGVVPRYDYFGLTNEQILIDHRYDVSKYPETNHLGYGYYDRSNLVMKKRNQMKDYVASVLRSGKSDCVFKLLYSSNGNNLDFKVSSEIQELLTQLRMNLQYTMDFNFNQRVFNLHFER